MTADVGGLLWQINSSTLNPVCFSPFHNYLFVSSTWEGGGGLEEIQSLNTQFICQEGNLQVR